MPFNTASVAATTTPVFLKTFFQHFLDKPGADSPRHQLAYDEAIVLVKKFLEYGAKHTVEQVQSFTANKIPCPSWVAKEDVTMPQQYLDRAASVLIDHLGPTGLKTFGGSNWWQYRIEPMKCEWIEMKKEKRLRESGLAGHKTDRIILYVHGGAYYFGSVDEHRYQIQRHARKLGGRAFAANYRLSPQFPAPCGIQDNLAAYLYLLKSFAPENIILSGDSAGGGMCLALLLVLRDQGLPLPAGCVLISPWVDLNHSFPSIMGDSSGDYIPSSGFQHKPSISWPPPTSDDIAEARALKPGDETDDEESISSDSDDGQGFTVEETSGNHAHKHSSRTATVVGNEAQIEINGKLVTIKDQIQLYATNEQISHPLVSPVIAGSLGGLCPLFIMCGGSELLRDEIIYTAHKAANPQKYPPMDAYLDRDRRQRDSLNKYGPTTVHLQVYDDCCHVTPTIAMCRPAKYMYRAIANFSLWALARFEGAQQQDIVSLLRELNLVYEETNGDSESDASESAVAHRNKNSTLPEVKVTGVEPVYVDHMIRERVSIYGLIRQMEAISDIAALALDPREVGVIKPGPVQKFMNARGAHDRRYRKRKIKLQRQRAREYARAESEGFAIGDFEGDKPPPAAMAGRASLQEAEKIHKSSKGSKSGGLITTMFSIVSGSRDKQKVQNEDKIQQTNN